MKKFLDKRGSFGSRFGAIVAVGGSVVGLGNIWRFPYLAGENGGGAFIIAYILISFSVAVPIMLAEFGIGRSVRRNAKRAFQKLAPGKGWKAIGYLGIATAFVILSYYCVVAGWALNFLKQAALNQFEGKNILEINQQFNAFISSGWSSLFWTWTFIAATGIIVYLGVEKGIERYNKIFMPLLVLILIILVINSFTLPGYEKGFSFLFKPDLSKINGEVLLKALGQSFFSLSLGMGAMITYGAYIKKEENLFHIAGTVSITDVSVAILSGMAIFPAVFALGINPTSGPELIFITLPNVFQQMPGGYYVGVLFFILVFFAAITSSVSLLEVVTAYISQEMRLGRKRASIIATLGVVLTGSLCVISQTPESTLTLGGKNLVDFCNDFSSNYMLPIGGFFIVLFAGWVMKPEIFQSELTSKGVFGKHIYPIVRFLIRFVTPIVIALLFMDLTGLI
ncbi:MAG: sodium-dependent transporter [Bacteroidales bacterium]|nr:sodium-dependent transporter [Bacteroidales bacterium]